MMRIQGLQKMTLLDYPGRVACTAFLGGCDFRCPFCHNFSLVEGPLPPGMDEDALFGFLERRRGLLDGVVVTGGEPCLRGDLPEFLARIRGMGFSVKLDTNGNHPHMLATVIERGLVDYVAMDIKNAPDKYASTVGLGKVDIGPIDESIRLLLGCGIDFEFRTTVVRELHEAADFEAMGMWASGAPLYCLQPFEGGDSVPDGSLSSPTPQMMRAFRDILDRYVGEAHIRGMDDTHTKYS